MAPPNNNEEFNNVYNSMLHWFWTDIRIPKELKNLAKNNLAKNNKPTTSLEFGCGLGRFSSFMAKQGIKATGIDFSSVAIEKAKNRIDKNEQKPLFLVGDVTNLEMLNEVFDVSYDIGCFHCLDKSGHKKYASEVYRLLKPNAIHLIWALDNSPSDLCINPDYISEVFKDGFQLMEFKSNRRRLAKSHWYWLIRNDS
jgi:ubiquinone/menaquinone biosynthesis C-methylase UbiE